MNERVLRQAKRTLADRVGAWLDRAVELWNPERAARRMMMRAGLQRARDLVARNIQQRAYDGADTSDARDRSWLGSRLSADSALEEDLDTLRTRSRELYRNDSVGGAVETRTNLVVSYGFTPQSKVIPGGGLSEEQARRLDEQLEQVYLQLYPRLGQNGTESLWQLLRLVERHHGFDGESLTILSDIPSRDKPVPLTVEVIDPERLETPPGKQGDANVRLGIEYDDRKRIVAYWIRKTHPHDTLDNRDEYDRVPAERVLHVFEKWFAGQSRALPWLTRTLNRIKDVHDFDEATIIAAQIEACFAMYIEEPTPTAAIAASLAGDRRQGRLWEDIRPGMIRRLDPGEKINSGAPQRPGNTYEPFMEQQHRQIAAGANFPYEMLAKDWSGLSFAAGRLSLTDARLFVRSEQKLLTELWLMRIWQRMVHEAVMLGAVALSPAEYLRAPWRYTHHTWTPPAWPYALTPGEEIDATVTAIDNNLKTKAEAVAEFGGNWEEVAAQRKRERERERNDQIEPPMAAKLPPPRETPQDRERNAA